MTHARLLVCGGREYADVAQVARTLDALLAKATANGHQLSICHGGAGGADRLAGEWAASRGVACTVFRADWNRHGRAAGPLRNGRMLAEFRPHRVVAFPGGRGTADMCARAEAAGVRVMRIGGTATVATSPSVPVETKADPTWLARTLHVRAEAEYIPTKPPVHDFALKTWRAVAKARKLGLKIVEVR